MTTAAVRVIDKDATRDEIIEALGYVNHEAKRTPIHYTERKASLHAFIDQLLTLLEDKPE